MNWFTYIIMYTTCLPFRPLHCNRKIFGGKLVGHSCRKNNLNRSLTIDHRNACERFSDTALLLSSTFKNAIRIADAEDVIWVTINRLEKELSANPTNTAWINHHLANQYEKLKRTLITNQHLIRPTKRHSSNLEPAGLLH